MQERVEDGRLRAVVDRTRERESARARARERERERERKNIERGYRERVY